MIDQADVVVIGAGAFGSSVAYHLAKLGKRDVALLDRFDLASQTSPRAAGLTSMVRGSDPLTRLAQRSVQKLKAFPQETGQPLRFDQSGALKIARLEQHVRQLHREVERARRVDVPNDFVSTAEARRLMPFLEDKGVLAVTNASISPLSSICASERSAGAKPTVTPGGSAGSNGMRPGSSRPPCTHSTSAARTP